MEEKYDEETKLPLCWLYRTLGREEVREVVDVNSGKDYKHLSQGMIPVYGTGGYMLSVSESLSDADGIGIGRKGTIDKPYILKAPFWTVDTLFYCIPRDANNLYFVYSIFNNVTWKKFDESTGVPSLSKITINNIQSFFPSFPEQTAIGSFFQELDQLISLQQRKLEVLKEQKKTYLKLLFPVKGQTKPGLRFAGFEDDWREVKLGEVGEIQTGNTPPTNEEDNYEKNGFPWVTPTDINSLVLHTTSKQLSDVGKSKARIAKSGSILVTCIASIGKNTLVRTDSAFNQQINSLTPSEKYSSYFLLTQSEIWSRYMLSVAGAGTMQIINKSDFSNIKAMVPTLPEQEAIGSFFQDLDKAIAKQEEKVNQLKESKQTLLKKMFI